MSEPEMALETSEDEARGNPRTSRRRNGDRPAEQARTVGTRPELIHLIKEVRADGSDLSYRLDDRTLVVAGTDGATEARVALDDLVSWATGL